MMILVTSPSSRTAGGAIRCASGSDKTRADRGDTSGASRRGFRPLKPQVCCSVFLPGCTGVEPRDRVQVFGGGSTARQHRRMILPHSSSGSINTPEAIFVDGVQSRLQRCVQLVVCRLWHLLKCLLLRFLCLEQMLHCAPIGCCGRCGGTKPLLPQNTVDSITATMAAPGPLAEN